MVCLFACLLGLFFIWGDLHSSQFQLRNVFDIRYTNLNRLCFNLWLKVSNESVLVLLSEQFPYVDVSVLM